MSKDKCTLSVDKENNQILLDGLVEDVLSIDYSGDIEFTKLVTSLAERIDVGKPIKLEVPDEEDEKTGLVIDVIRSIFSKYNESVEATDVATPPAEGVSAALENPAVVEEDDIPF